MTDARDVERETGKAMAPEQALAMFARSTAWLRERLLNGPRKCACGACWLCAYNTFATLTAQHEAALREIGHLKSALSTKEDRTQAILSELTEAQREIERLRNVADAHLTVLRAAEAQVRALREALVEIKSLSKTVNASLWSTLERSIIEIASSALLTTPPASQPSPDA